MPLRQSTSGGLLRWPYCAPQPRLASRPPLSILLRRDSVDLVGEIRALVAAAKRRDHRGVAFLGRRGCRGCSWVAAEEA